MDAADRRWVARPTPSREPRCPYRRRSAAALRHTLVAAAIAVAAMATTLSWAVANEPAGQRSPFSEGDEASGTRRVGAGVALESGDREPVAARPAPGTSGWLLPGLDDVAEPNPSLVAAVHLAADAARQAHGATATVWDDGLARAARQHAAELAERNVLDHLSLDPARRTVADRLARAGSPYATHAENLAAVPPGFDVVQETVEGWLASPSHRANLLRPDFNRVGLGTAASADGTVFVAQVLAHAPWIPVSWTTALVSLSVSRLVLDLIVGEPTTVLVEIDGNQERRLVDTGRTVWQTDVATPGPWAVIVAVLTDRTNLFAIEDAGTLGTDGTWRGDGHLVLPRSTVRIDATSVETIVRDVVRLRMTLPAADAQVVVGSGHAPWANVGGGRLELDLELDDGAELTLGLAEPGGDGILDIRHRWVLRREGSAIRWTARP